MFINNNDIYDKESAFHFLNTLGMDNLEIEELVSYLCDFMLIEHYLNTIENWKLDSANNYELRQSLICEIQDLADNLASGKGGTKVQYADRLRNLCEYYA